MSWTYTPLTFFSMLVIGLIWLMTFMFLRRLDTRLIEVQDLKDLDISEKQDYEKDVE